MAVEIVVLSGARRNERIVLDCRAFQAGCGPTCDVRFDPQRDPAAIGRTAKFYLQEGGWCVRSAGGEMWVGTRPIAGLTHLRSGDVIRMSASGPEFSFAIVAAATASPAKPSDDASGLSLASGENRGASAAATVTEPPHEPVPTAAASLPADLPKVQPAAATATARKTDRQWATWAAVVAVGILVLVAVKVLLSPSTPVVVVVPGPGGQGQTSPPLSPPPVVPGKPPKPETKEAEPARTSDPAAALFAKIDPAVYLIATEKDRHYWPHATCVAVGNDTLLTTAFDAMDLAKMRDKESYKIWVTRPANKSSGDGVEFDPKLEVQDIRMLAPYAVLPDKPGSTERLFVNLGLLTVRGALPKFAAVASASESAAIKAGLRVHCFGFAQDHTMMTADDVFQPLMSKGSVRFIESAKQKLPGDPKLLLIHGEIPENSYGNPIVSDEGKILGMYSDAVPKEKHLKDFHYITMVMPEQVDLWLRDRNNASIWVPATASPAASTTEKQP